MLSRQVITRSGRHFRGRYPSKKMDRMIAFESLNERDAILRLEFSPWVHSYREQPELILYGDGERLNKYYPDFEATLQNGIVMHIEVKPMQKLCEPETFGKLTLIRKHYSSHRREYFHILTDEDMQVEPLASNLKTLSAIRTKPFDLTTHPPIDPDGEPWGALEQRLGRATLLKLIAHGLWLCDLRRPFTDDLPVKHSWDTTDDPLYL